MKATPSLTPWHRLAAVTGLVACQALHLGCADRTRHNPPTATRIAARLAVGEEPRLSRDAVIHTEVETFSWRLDNAVEAARWVADDPGIRLEPRPKGLFTQIETAKAGMVRNTVLHAERVSAIRVTHSGLAKGTAMRLSWAAAGEPFASDRSVTVDEPDPGGALRPAFTFDVGRHSGWRGVVDRLRLEPCTEAGRKVTVVSVTGLLREISPDLLNAIAGAPWLVDLKGDVRVSLIGIPEHEFEAELKVPNQPVLRFALGLEEEVSDAVTFTVSAARDGREPETVFEEEFVPTAAGVWHQRSVSLERYAGERVRLLFTTRGAASTDLHPGAFPAWASPEIVTTDTRSRPPNVLLIVLDTLRADHMSLYGYQRPTTPRIDTWARERGVVFENAVAQAPWTLPSHVSLFTGLDTLSHGINTNQPAPGGLTMVAETLAAAGYTTHAITGGGMLTPEHGLLQGFDRVDYWYLPRLKPATAADDIAHGTELAIEWLESTTDRPFFLLFHTYETHAPYRPRQPFFDRFHGAVTGDPPLVGIAPRAPREEDGYVLSNVFMERQSVTPLVYEPLPPERLSLVTDLYDSGVAHADAHVGRILDHLVHLGLDRNTVVVIASDHGESLGDRGFVGHSSLERCELLVPLLVALPDGRWAGRRVAAQVRLMDVAPTLLELCGRPASSEGEGRSLLPLLEDEASDPPRDALSYAASANYGFSLRVDNRLRYTFNNSAWPAVNGLESLFHIDDDPLESHDVAGHDPAVGELRSRLDSAVLERSSGVRLAFANHEASPLTITLEGPMVRPLRVKSMRLTTPDITWRSAGIHLTVAPGTEATFLLEGTPFGQLLVTAEAGANRITRVLETPDLVEPWLAGFDGTGWSEGSAAATATATVRAWIHGQPFASTSGLHVDAQVKEQLRQLGYLQ